MQALAVRKYLDALCVYFWAATSLLFSLFTFGLFVLLGHKLTAEVVFTSLALFNVLISPLNSFPWILNGLVEAVVLTTTTMIMIMAMVTSIYKRQSLTVSVVTAGPHSVRSVDD